MKTFRPVTRPRTPLRNHPRLTTLAATALVAASAHPAAAAGIYLESIERTSPSELRLGFVDDGVNEPGYVLETAPGLTATSWTPVPDPTVAPAGAGRFAITVPLHGESRGFFRVRSIAADAIDSDWDGLSNPLEIWLGIDPDNPDSDGDLFSDGLEASHGNDPWDAEDFPDLHTQPSVRFATSSSEAQEGDGALTIPLAMDPSFTGPVFYEVALLSNAETTGTSSDFTTLSGQVQVTGPEATLDLTCLDDAQIEEAEILVIDLLDDPGGRYHVGGIPRHTLMLFDNDAYWNGVLMRENAELPFRLRLIESASGTTATLVSSLDPAQAGGAPGIGTIPPGEWPLTVTRGAGTFEAASGPIPSTTSLMFQADLLRTLTLRAVPPEDPENPEVPYRLTDRIIVGTYTDTLGPVDASMGYLERATEGAFILTKDLPVMEAVTIPTQEATP